MQLRWVCLVALRAHSAWRGGIDFDDYGYDDEDAMIGQRWGGPPPRKLDSDDRWFDEQLSDIEKQADEVTPVSQVAVEMTKDIREGLLSFNKDLQLGFKPRVMEDAARDPYYFISRNSLKWTNDLVVEPGLYFALIKAFYNLRKYYGTYIAHNPQVPERALLLRLKQGLDSCKALKTEERQSHPRNRFMWGDEFDDDDFDDEDDEDAEESSSRRELPHWETEHQKHLAKVLGRGMVRGMSVMSHFGTPMQLRNEGLHGKGNFGSFYFRTNYRQSQRHSTLAQVGAARPYHLGSLTYFDALARALYLADQVHPFDPEITPLYALFTPKNANQWTPSAQSLYEKLVVLLAKCLADVPLPVSTRLK